MAERDLRKEERGALLAVAEAASALRQAHERWLAAVASEDVLEAVRDEARALRRLDEALNSLHGLPG